MKLSCTAVALAATLALVAGAPVAAQTTNQTKVEHDTGMKDGVATTTTKVTHVQKRKTHRPRKIFGVKLGHKTVTNKTVRETKASSNGDMSTTTKTSH